MASEDETPKKRAVIVDFISGQNVDAKPEEVEAVQVFSKRLVEDYRYDKNNIQTHPQFRVKKRPSDEEKSYPVDIAVFTNSQKTDENLFLVVECKQRKKEAGRAQLEIYLTLSHAKIGVWFNGKSHLYLRKIVKPNGEVLFEELTNIPSKGQRIEDVGKYKRKDLIATHNLKEIFIDINDKLAATAVGEVKSESIARQIINLLLCKIYDELNTAPEEIVTFRAGISEDKGEVRKRISNLFETVKKEYRDVFSKTDELTIDTNSLAYIVGELQIYCIHDAERDALGDAFEVFIGKALKGEEGQFFTPRNVVKMAVEILDPAPGEKVIDPACGSGGFLIVALEHVWKKISETAKQRNMNSEWIRAKQEKVATECFRGIDKEGFLAKVTKAHMAIIGDGRGGIFCENSLLQPSEWEQQTRNKIGLGQFDVLFTNPPFGAKLPIEGEILGQYDLGHKWKRDMQTRKWIKLPKLYKQQPPQIIFIERCLQLLKDGGRMAIILPDGILAGEKIGYIAEYLKDKAEIIALIDLPLETFCPMTTTKTHLVCLRKKPFNKPADDEVFMAVTNAVGHDRKGKKRDPDELPIISKNYEGCKKKSYSKNDLGYLVKTTWLEESLVARRYLPKYLNVLKEIKDFKGEKETLDKLSRKISTGANVDNTDYVEGEGLPYILVKNITYEGINLADLKYLKSSNKDKVKNAIVKEGDILINRAGNTGISGIVPKDLDGGVACGFVFKVSIKTDYDPYYIAGFLNSRLGRLQMERVSLGSVLEHITKTELKNVVILLPDKTVRNRISKDMKEAVNKRVEARALLKDINEALSQAT